MAINFMEDRLSKIIMVIRREDLFGKDNDKDYFQGFKHGLGLDYEERIFHYHGFITRRFADGDPIMGICSDTNYKQPIGYGVIVNPEIKKVFFYQRAKQDKHYGEKRLQGKWSLGIGGHIEKTDWVSDNPILFSTLREAIEEVDVEDPVIDNAFGYINDDSNDVGKVHFGIVYILNTRSQEVIPKDPEIASGELKTLDELDDISSSQEFVIEDWSRIIFPVVFPPKVKL